MEIFKNTLGDLLVSHASGSFGESAEGITSALHSTVSTLAGALTLKGRSASEAKGLMDYIASQRINGNLLNHATGLLDSTAETESLMANGSTILNYLLGDRTGQVGDLISGEGRLKTSSANALLKLTAPFVLATLARYVEEKSLDTAGVKTLLSGQLEFIKPSLPKGMDTLLGLDSIIQSNNNTNPMDNSSTPSSSKSPISKFLPWIVLLLAALGLFYFVQKGCGSSNTPAGETPATADTLKTETSADAMDVNTPPTSTGSTLVYTMKDGTKMELERTSFSAWMIDFLKGTAPGATGYGTNTPNCMPFDHVSFDQTTGGLTASSEQELFQVYTILKSYPEVIVSIEGHTDNTGDPEQSKLLSEQQAQKVKGWLEKKGIAADRLISSGWGERNPKASNDTEEGRKINNQVQVCIVKK